MNNPKIKPMTIKIKIKTKTKTKKQKDNFSATYHVLSKAIDQVRNNSKENNPNPILIGINQHIISIIFMKLSTNINM